MHHGDVILSAETYDRFYDGYVALADALTEARLWVNANAPYLLTVEQELLERIDAALAMQANLPAPE